MNAARFLASRGDADADRLTIDGGSAGGYTTLAALTFYDVFKAGASYYGVSDLEALAKETHKFESRYLDSLVGRYPEEQDLYRQRSPIHHTHLLSCPLLLLQGLEDEIVPPNQAEMMFEAVRDKGLPAAYVAFEGEQHGFRRAENIKRALEAELYFYAKGLRVPTGRRHRACGNRKPPIADRVSPGAWRNGPGARGSKRGAPGLVVAAIGTVGAPAVKVHPLAGELEVGGLLKQVPQLDHHLLAHRRVHQAAAADADQVGVWGQVRVVPRLLLKRQLTHHAGPFQEAQR